MQRRSFSCAGLNGVLMLRTYSLFFFRQYTTQLQLGLQSTALDWKGSVGSAGAKGRDGVQLDN